MTAQSDDVTGVDDATWSIEQDRREVRFEQARHLTVGQVIDLLSKFDRDATFHVWVPDPEYGLTADRREPELPMHRSYPLVTLIEEDSDGIELRSVGINVWQWPDVDG